MALRRSRRTEYVSRRACSHHHNPDCVISTVMTGFVGIFIPFSKTMDLIYAAGGCLLFSGYIVYDTHIINARLSPDEYIMAAISLYLEYVFIRVVFESTLLTIASCPFL